MNTRRTVSVLLVIAAVSAALLWPSQEATGPAESQAAAAEPARRTVTHNATAPEERLPMSGP